ncbi:MAG: Dihydrolipoamide acyltransferase component of branched-chain alpha-keto acid dehydrogenase complex [Candidatus Carbobacillus altaicus]|uniref:Dihydrolipoamide acetyltransferase component of pyruvate dehydrogenase complex n=1 Tax=Candidatus Carbonibacillus altaicus TaxID=2163959 RepID=A0A2R6Y385_9BACL|nr:MAG: Dihydrolipoamide acyltransferase component of branched-chain alpha-keto acid dehydrogenase complex [Candidatus Carbobacillus altaicus]
MTQPKIISMPKLGESVTEGTIVRWLVQPGDTVAAYDPLCEIETDKVTAEVPAPEAGRILEIIVSEGETVAVGTPIARLESNDASQIDQVRELNEPTKEEEKKRSMNGPIYPAKPESSSPDLTTATDKRRRYSPAVLKLAGEHGIDLSQVVGTGEGGRVTRKDVLNFIASGKHTSTQPAPEKPQAPSYVAEGATTKKQTEYTPSRAQSLSITSRETLLQEAEVPPAERGDTLVAVSSVRRTIARRMVESKHTAPHAWMMVEVDVTKLVRYREKIKEQFFKQEGIRLTYLPFFIQATIRALKQYPVLNASWTDEGILYKKDIHISIAVAHNDLLYVPVIHHADEKSLIGLARAIDDLIRRTRNGKLTIEDTEGGTFTVNNTGAFGSILSMPIINQPQAAILSVEAIVKRPVVIDEMIAIRDMVNLTLSIDHRVLDGAVAGRFLQKIKHDLENFEPDADHS